MHEPLKVDDPPVQTTTAIARWACGLRLHDVPDDVQRTARVLALDGFGCGLYGMTLPWVAVIRDVVADLDAGPAASLWGTGRTASVLNAPLVNGTAIHSFEFDDLHATAVLHGAAQVLPAALAIAELRHSGAPKGRIATCVPAGLPNGNRLLLAIVAGLEVGARVGLATGSGQLRRGFHPSPNSGLFSAAATASVLLELDAEKFQHALGIAGSCGGSLMAAQRGATVKRLHAGRAAQAGVQAALLAARGLTGISDVLEAEYGGFASAYADVRGADIDAIGTNLGQRWESRAFTLKQYPCCGSSHTSIDAFTQIQVRHPDLRVQDIESIDVQCSTLTYDHVGWPYEPLSVTTAQMSLRYALAVMAVDGVVSVRSFDPKRISDPDLLGTAALVRVSPNREIDSRGRSGRHAIMLTVTMRSGQRYTASVDSRLALPCTEVTDAEVTSKFRDQAGAVLDDSRLNRLERAVLGLGEQSAAVNDIVEILRGKPNP